MAISANRKKKIRDYIIKAVANNIKGLSSNVAKHFDISRQSANNHIKAVEAEGLIEGEGNTRSRTYRLRAVLQKKFNIHLDQNQDENVLWRKEVKEFLGESLTPDLLDACHYGFTEMFNNVIDHSSAKVSIIELKCTAVTVEISIADDGIGIFEKIQRDLNLEDTRHVLLELSKGKLTTDPENHTGEGIFFTSRLCHKFSISSGKSFFWRQSDKDWFFEATEIEPVGGTLVSMTFDINSTKTVKNVMDEYAPEFNNYGFTRTVVPVSLAAYEGENLVSRSQAKRLYARFEKFSEVVLDFKDVKMIGRAFTDQLFRVFPNEHSNTKLTPINTNRSVSKIITSIKSSRLPLAMITR